ncbi:hypothetical protein M092_0885 [Parabacteroides distasonis str. 3776 D15 iv]|uniref:Uncharacterized protein n=1 Tax=Parabacteroides distasonis str. 3776 D15 i TaxID=1339342 RepID=A0AB34LGN9_PARDI|nr:hypothetical protein M091_3754 [Parabacteroides distasonis str. 3776 D15 i]KDS54103.1 hypothetical protein M090_1486 [Parabacteroides distasonis str. 3776 Po2 i]KDS72135.1 hypothetical protein M092_0885 [Parabacteroides distasonis str. 3776 D15 iv]
MSAEVTDEHSEIYSHISFMRLVSLVMTRAQDVGPRCSLPGVL